jgi:hypothetical protein
MEEGTELLGRLKKHLEQVWRVRPGRVCVVVCVCVCVCSGAELCLPWN